MNKRKLELSKSFLTKVGQFLPDRTVLSFGAAFNYVQLGRWMRSHGFEPQPTVPKREDIFRLIAAQVQHRQTLYLEFGVFRGESIRAWSSLLTRSDSEFHGFDSFEGLPELFDDRLGVGIGYYTTDGLIPQVTDPRVRFHKGWFDETLPKFTVPRHDQLVIGLDADLYSSTKIVLESLDRWIVEGTYLYFDDLAHIDHEARAFGEYIARTGKQFEFVAGTRSLDQSAFVCVGV